MHIYSCCPNAMICSARSIPAMKNKVPIHREDCYLHLFAMHLCHFISHGKSTSSHLFWPSAHPTYSQCHNPNPARIPANPVLSSEIVPGRILEPAAIWWFWSLTFLWLSPLVLIIIKRFIHLIPTQQNIMGHFGMHWWEVINHWSLLSCHGDRSVDMRAQLL